jgi:hypothetical protein
MLSLRDDGMVMFTGCEDRMKRVLSKKWSGKIIWYGKRYTNQNGGV